VVLTKTRQVEGVRVTMFAVQSKKYYILGMCVYSLSYEPCKEHLCYFIVICGLFRLYSIFPHYLINTIFGRKSLNVKCVF
jgi:hypothetical protein